MPFVVTVLYFPVLSLQIASKNELIETLKRDVVVIKTKYRDVVTELTIQKATNRKIYEEFSKRYDHLFATYGCHTWHKIKKDSSSDSLSYTSESSKCVNKQWTKIIWWWHFEKKNSYWEDTKTMWTIFRRNNLVPAKTDTINIVNDLEHLPVSLTWHRMCVSWELILRCHPFLSENVNCSASIHVPHILASIWLLSSAPPPHYFT